MQEAEVFDLVKRLAGVSVHGPIRFVEDTSQFLDISRGSVLDFNGTPNLVLGNMYELRFTLEDQPKYWVKSAIEVPTGKKKIIKWAFDEEFVMTIGKLSIRCYRSPEKEGDVLDLVVGNPHFMQGGSVCDSAGSSVRVIDFIKGRSLFAHLLDLEMEHEAYFADRFPEVFLNLRKALGGIKILHDNEFCHGDIRNDHILIDAESGIFRWIDFDLKQDYSDYDIWSVGNTILFCAGKGIHTFQNVRQNSRIPQKAMDSLERGDASAFFKNRIINLRKLFPYIPAKLNDILMHFSFCTDVFYDRIDQILDDIDEVLAGL